MHYGVGQPRVAVVFGLDENGVAGSSNRNRRALAFGSTETVHPSRIDFAIDARGIMCGRAAEESAPLRMRMVGVGASVDKEIFIVDG